jgi:hypothetical protein
MSLNHKVNWSLHSEDKNIALLAIVAVKNIWLLHPQAELDKGDIGV